MEQTKLLHTFRQARLRGVPIVSIATPDQSATIAAIQAAEVERNTNVPLLSWDICTGLRPLNSIGEIALMELVGIKSDSYNPNNDEQVIVFQNKVRSASLEPQKALVLIRQLPGYNEETKALGSLVFINNAQEILADDFPPPIKSAVRQAIANLRDIFEDDHRMLVLLGPDVPLPGALKDDIIPMIQDYPTDDQLKALILDTFKGARLANPKPELLKKAQDALRGIAYFPAKQITAMSLSTKHDGLDIDALRERKRIELEKVEGLSVLRESAGLNFSKVGGKDQLKHMLELVFHGQQPPGLAVVIDEGEKFMGEHEATTDQLAVFLTAMQDEGYTGIILVSAPGVGKTHIAKAVGGQFDVMSVKLDLGATKSKWYGSSEQKIRYLFRVLKAIAGPGGVFFILTCNKMEKLPPEFRRRFRRGIWYDDIPNAAEKVDIWTIHLTHFGISLDSPRPDDTGWTGADIFNCCEGAWNMKISLIEAAQFFVPVSISDPESISSLRALAQGSFLSTAYPGEYKGIGEKVTVSSKSPSRTRRIQLTGDN